MSFQSPLLLIGLLAVPLLIGFYLYNQRRRHQYTVRFTNLALLNQVVGKGPGFRRHVPAILFVVALTGLLVSLAKPQATLRVPKEKASVVLAIDVSGSMAATDVQPTRIDAAISAARTLVDDLPGQDSIGVISFNSQATVVAPLTTDHGSVKDALGQLQPGGGTAIGDAIQASLSLLGPVVDQSGKAPKKPPAIIVLLTDGSSNRGIDPLTAAAQAQLTGVPVETIGIGARNQTTQVFGQTVDGVDEQALQAIASATGGHYFYAADQGQLHQIYDTLGSRIGFTLTKVDLTIPVMATATFLLVIGGLFSLRWFRLLP
ncbi:MAG TPA: VWA domain-containing protein [Candidatus Limnocylindrales bacterium]|nr:VWA domain-containing protein [Candidatus Limnocylindrales bacterium]